MDRTGHSVIARLRRIRGREAFTLIEMVMSLLVVSILLVGIGSTMLLASRAVPNAKGPAARLYLAQQATDQMLAELHQAMHITERTARSITFTVPDRNADGRPEVIRYSWSGTAGDALRRQYNGVIQTALNSVNTFALTYDTVSVSEVCEGAPVPTGEQIISAYDPLLVLLPADWQVDSSKWIGHTFLPAGPLGTRSVSITRVAVYANSDGGGSGDNLFQIRRTDASGKPLTTALASVTVPESTLGDGGLLGLGEFAWEEVNLPVAEVPAGERLCLLIRHIGSGSSSGKFRYDGGGSGMVSTTDGGATWSGPQSKWMQHYVWGFYSVRGTPQTLPRNYFRRISVSLSDGLHTSSHLASSTALANSPEVLSAVWEADFAAAPTLIDLNNDTYGDFATADSSAFNTGSLVAGVWKADKTLVTWPSNDFIEPVTIEARYRNTSTAGASFVTINADNTGGLYMPIIAQLQKQADGTQTLTVFHHTSDTAPVAGIAVAGLDAGMVDLRLLIDPARDTVNVQVNRVEHGTFRYVRYAPSGSNGTKKYASFYATNTGGEFDYVRVRTGGTP